MDMKVHNESHHILEDFKFNDEKCFELDSHDIKGMTDIKFISALYLFGDTLYIGTRSSKLYIYDLENDEEGSRLENQRILIPHCETVNQITANHRYFITVQEADDENAVSVWDTKSLNFQVSLKGHQSQVAKVMFLEDSNYVVTGSWDNSVRVWCLKKLTETGEYLVATTESEYPVLVVEEVRKGVLAFGGDDCFITIWDFEKNQTLGRFFGHAGSVTFLMMENNYLMSLGGDCKVKLWEVYGQENNSKLEESNQKQIEEEMASKAREEEPQQEVIDFDNISKLRAELKMNHDATVFMCHMPKLKQNFFIDRYGNGFIVIENRVLEGINKFSYGVNVTGVVCFGGLLYISTTKGELKECRIVKKYLNNEL